MFIKIPFESEIEFKNNICEITKMSLEHDFNISEKVVLGNFYVSGEYRVHEVSVNTEPFNYTLPFEVELRDDIKVDTLEFNIEDFSYDILNKKLKVNIEYSLKAEIDETEELFERVDEEVLESELAYIDSFLEEGGVLEETSGDVKASLINEEKIIVESCPEESIEKDEKKIKEENEEKKIKEEFAEERVTVEEEKTIMDTIKDSDDTFVTYHIHIIKEAESIENICTMYNVSLGLVQEYNNIDNISAGDKILIPKLDE